MRSVQVFYNSNFLLKSLTLSLATNTASCFLWSDRLHLLIFEKTSTTYPSGLKNHSLSVILSSKSDAPWKKWPVQLVTETEKYFSKPRQPLGFTPRHRAEGFICTSYYIIEIINKVCSQRWRYNKIHSFYYLTKNIRKWNWL